MLYISRLRFIFITPTQVPIVFILDTYSNLSNVSELKNYLIEKYTAAAQYGRPPVYKATAICKAIDGAQTKDILDRIFAGLVAYYGPEKSCYNTTESLFTSQTYLGWTWQVKKTTFLFFCIVLTLTLSIIYV